MILLTTDFPFKIAETAVTKDVPVGVVILVSAVFFIAASIIGGVCSYKIKLKKLKEKLTDKEASAGENEVK